MYQYVRLAPGGPGPPLVDMGTFEVVDSDCNSNGTSDACDIQDGTSEDCSGNGVPDDCEPDCNGNDVADSCDIMQGTSEDCNSNGVPDDCEPDQDCNDNGVQDICDIAAGESYDCNANNLPDECEGGGNIYHVDDDAPGDPAPGDPSVGDPAEDGSPDHPYDEIQEAIDASLCGKVVLVAAGTYIETIDFLGKAITLRSAAGPDFTIIDGGGDGAVLRCERGEGSDTVVEGFTITGGSVSGMRNSFDSTPTVSNCRFTGNSASFGGGMNNLYSNPTVTDCTFSANTALNHGGGMHNFYSNPTVTNCTFNGCEATWYGGGMYNSNSSPVVTNCTFRGNTALFYGGGMSNSFDSFPTVTNCLFGGNFASYGGGMHNNASGPIVTHCTFTANESSIPGGGIRNVAGSLALTNCILWGDIPDEISDALGAVTTVRHSDVQGAWPGAGANNINADPSFVDLDGADDDPATWQDNDYHLAAGSPCIDSADNSAVSADETDLDDDGDTNEPIPFDLDGNPRFVDDPDTEDCP